MPDPWEAPDTQDWMRHVREEMLPKLRESAATISLVTGTDLDVKFAVELGASIMLDKPLIILVSPGAVVPEHLVRAADVIIDGDPSDPKVARRLRAAVDEVTGQKVYGDDDA